MSRARPALRLSRGPSAAGRWHLLRLGAAALAGLASVAGAADLCAVPPAPPDPVLWRKTCAVLDAVNRKDPAALRGLMAEDFALTSVSGRYHGASRAEMVQRWTAPDEPGTTSRSTLTALHRVFRSGDLGFVSGVIEDRTQKGPAVECSTHAFTDIWVSRDGAWQWLQSHESGSKTSRCGP